MIILIGNQKGGVGKSTFTLLLANYLTQLRYCKVTVLDLDPQQSIVQQYQKAKLLENKEPYEVRSASLEDFPTLLPALHLNPEELTLIDLPGRLDEDGLIPVVSSADLVLCPFCYDEFSFGSTVLFSVVLQKINPELELAYIPNRMMANLSDDTLQEVDRQLGKFGLVTYGLPDWIDFQWVNTLHTPEIVLPLVRRVMDQLFTRYLSFLLEDLSAGELNDD
ncbi:ParA family protein [Pedobacter foliorum]|uniref:ParA family protein n=1 Tax=Pedobacter foliorum TaxID=2739058 RepID=UPI001566B581|nr:ParA family protein [Pedobacter foliorum]NRF37558.1 ParA family protein [Pedobacter foliorum]